MSAFKLFGNIGLILGALMLIACGGGQASIVPVAPVVAPSPEEDALAEGGEDEEGEDDEDEEPTAPAAQPAGTSTNSSTSAPNTEADKGKEGAPAAPTAPKTEAKPAPTDKK